MRVLAAVFLLLLSAAPSRAEFAITLLQTASAQQPPPAAPPTSAPSEASVAPSASAADRPLPASQSPVTVSPFRITGTVINAITGDPLPHCSVSAALVPMGRAGRRRPQSPEGSTVDDIQTDAQGHFDITVPSAGNWWLSARTRGFRRQNYEEHEEYFSGVVLTSASPSLDLIFKLLPNAAIEGLVLDEAGEPVRNASVSLLLSPQPGPGLGQPTRQTRGTTITDDRGHYEFADLAPGDYMVSLHARPWYTSAGGQSEAPATADPRPNPLDVVYPPQWYPGVTDFAAATPLSLEAGDRREADFHLIPSPSLHLRFAANPQSNPLGPDGGQGRMPPVPTLTESSPDGTQNFVQTAVQQDAQGNWELSGLSPGSYEVHRQAASGETAAMSVLQIAAGSPRTLDLSTTDPIADVAIALDGPGSAPGLQVNLVNLSTGQSNFAQPSGLAARQGPARDLRSRQQRPGWVAANVDAEASNAPQERTAQLQPGSYEVNLIGPNDHYLAGITATGAEATGRIVHLHAGSARLLLHVASGRAYVSGIVKSHGKPAVAATVLLVPATLGDPHGLTTLQRDQTNTDGSFELNGVLPGAYILIAIDHGWTVNWRDPSTLRRYLLGGIAIDLAPAAELQRDLNVQAP
jgi:Carboxypeptidase regulatory-like domain